MASLIEDYGFISNMRTGALVSRNAEIEWLCAPRFDSDACFSALVGYDEHGRWSMRPTEALREVKQRYRGDTLILETDFVCDGGTVRVTDFVAITEDGRCDVLRWLEGIEGSVQVETLLDVRFGYGASKPAITKPAQNAGPNDGTAGPASPPTPGMIPGGTGMSVWSVPAVVPSGWLSSSRTSGHVAPARR